MARNGLFLIIARITTKWHWHIRLEPSQFLDEMKRDFFDFARPGRMWMEVIVLSEMLFGQLTESFTFSHLTICHRLFFGFSLKRAALILCQIIMSVNLIVQSILCHIVSTAA
jgi:hypothetical protein